MEEKDIYGQSFLYIVSGEIYYVDCDFNAFEYHLYKVHGDRFIGSYSISKCDFNKYLTPLTEIAEVLYGI